MKRICATTVIGVLVMCLASCTRPDYTVIAHKSDELRILLVKYYTLNSHFPESLDSLRTINPQFKVQGGLWNGWSYALSDPDVYNLLDLLEERASFYG